MKKKLLLFFSLTCFWSNLANAGNIIIMRHGRALSNDLGILNANPLSPAYRPMPLTTLGRYQATQAGIKLKKILRRENLLIRRVFYSPLPRTKETAELASREIGVPQSFLIESAKIIEPDYGKFEGRPIEDFPYPPNDLSHNHEEEIQGEDTDDVNRRLTSFLMEDVKPLFDGDSTILVISHGTPSAMMTALFGEEPVGLGNAEFVILRNKSL